MEKLFKNQKYLSILLTFFINLAVLIVCICSGTMKYEVSDDFIMSAITSGAMGGIPEPYIMFMSPIAGFFLNIQYKLCSGINWYTWDQIILIFLSLCIISGFILKEINWFTVFVSFGFVLIVSLDLYQLMQFTKTSTIIITAGTFLLFLYLKKNEWKWLWFGSILIAIGSIIRFQSLYMVLPLAAVSWLILLGFKLFKKKNLYICSSMILFIGGGLFVTQNVFNTVNHQQNAYISFHSLRSDIVDYPYPIYEEISNELEAIDVSKNDYYSLTTWNFADPEVFSLDKLQGVLEILNTYRDNHKPTVKSILKEIYNQYFWTYIIFFPALIGYTILLFGNPKAFLKSLILGLTSIVLVVVTYIMGRVVYRVEYSILLTMFCFELLFLSQFPLNTWITGRKSRFLWMTAIVITVGIRIYYWIPDYDNPDKFKEMNISWANNPDKYKYSFNSNDFLDFNKLVSGEGIYYMEFNTGIQSYYLQFNPLIPIPESAYRNVFYLGGVDYLNPARTNSLNLYGLSGQISDLNEDQVFLVDSIYNDLVFGFIREHYSDSYTIEPVGNYSGYNIFKITW